MLFGGKGKGEEIDCVRSVSYTWAKSLNRGGLLEVKVHGKATIGTRPSGP